MLVDKTSFVYLLRKIKQYFDGYCDDEDDELPEDELITKGKHALKLVQVCQMLIFIIIYIYLIQCSE